VEELLDKASNVAECWLFLVVLVHVDKFVVGDLLFTFSRVED
jgi:hypothetical protein